MTKNISIFYEGQDDLVDILATSIASVCYNTKSFIDFYILDCGLSDFNKKQLESMKDRFDNFSIEFIPIDLAQFKGLKGYTAGNFTDCYSRLLIPDLKPELNKAIYLDTDTIILKDIQEFWDIDLEGNSLGALPDLGYREPVKKRFVEKLGGNPNQLFITGGVFIADCQKWREKKITQNLLNIAKEKKENLDLIIEDLFSLYFTSDYKLLDCRYAFIEIDNYAEDIPLESITTEYLENEFKNVVILHFAGDNKIWKSPFNIFTRKIHSHFHSFWHFATMTPFYEGMQNRYMWHIMRQIANQVQIQKKPSNAKTKIKLFNLLPVLTIKEKGYTKTYKLFGFIPLFKLKRK